MTETFRALMVPEEGAAPEVRNLTPADLPEGEVLVQVEWSDLNYKDAMVLRSQGRLVRRYPHIPGIDLAGTVLESASSRFEPGERVLVTGWHVGERHWGGYAERARLRADWLVPLPEGLTPRQAMAVGTAGFTAMLALQALESHGIHPDSGEVLVTGASGGVGSVAVMLLAALGYNVAALTGSPDNHAYLRDLGAQTIVDRAELADPPAKPLESERWAGVIDTVGGPILARALAQIAYGGAVAACGLAASPRLEGTVIPFLLRGARLLGIDSVLQPQENRVRAWARIAHDLPLEHLETATTVVGITDLADRADAILAGQTRGRTLVDPTA